MQAADALSLAALVRAAQALKQAQAYKDPSGELEALKAAVVALEDTARRVVDELAGKADAGHEHRDLAAGISLLRDAHDNLFTQVQGKAEGQHEHIEYAHVSKVQADLDVLQDAIEALSDAAESDRQETDETAKALRDDLSAAVQELGDRIGTLAEGAERAAHALSARIESKADAGHTHGEFDALLEAITEQAREYTRAHKRITNDISGLAKRISEARAIAEAKQERGPAGKDGKDGKPGAPGRNGTDAEPLKPMGEYAGGVYDALSIVRNNGALWLATQETDAVPSSSSDDWMLLIRDGKDGEDGQSIRGRRGAAGTDGTPGSGSSELAKRFTSVDTTITTADDVLIVQSNKTVHLPDATDEEQHGNKVYRIKRDTAAGDVRVQALSGQDIEGDPYKLINTNYDSMDVFSDGTHWIRL